MNQSWIRYLPAFIRQRLEGRHDLQKAIGNTGWLFAENILRMVVGFFIGVWVARYLGPERYGLLSYALAFVFLFSPIATLGLDDIVVRDIIRFPGSKDETLGTALVLKLFGGIVSFVAVIAVIFFLRPNDTQSHWLVGIIAVGSIFQSVSIIECWFNSKTQARYIALARSISFFICSAIKIVLLITRASLIAFAVVVALEIAISSFGLVVAFRSKGESFRDWRFTGSRAGTLLKDSLPLIFSIISIIVYQRIDQVMLQQMVGSKEVGIYSVAVRLAEVWCFIPPALYWSAFPAIMEAKNISDALFYERLQKFYNLMALSSYAIAIPVTLLSQWLVNALYGETYARAGGMLLLLIWANMFASLEIARSAFLNTMNWTRIYFVTVFLGGILNVVLNLCLIPRYGGMGAAAASLVAYGFAAYGTCFFFRSLFRNGIMLSKAIVFPKIW
jgi:O-antigen/teichoic acid export membrane protein